MNKQRAKNSQSKTSVTQSSALFLSFCRALDKYCDHIGVSNHRFSAARILHDAAGNTVAHMQTITTAQKRLMARMERKIPELFAGLIELSNTDGFLYTLERMSDMSLAQIAVIIARQGRQH